MNARLHASVAPVPRAVRRPRPFVVLHVVAGVALALGMIGGAAAAMPGMKGQPAAPADSVGAGLPKMGPLPAAPAVPPDLSRARKLKDVTVLVRHRVFQGFAEQITARLGDSFPISDTEYSAIVDRYVPDFAMDIKNGKVISRTAAENNPAVRVIVLEKGVPQDTTWALLDMPPHFGRKSMLAFQVTKLTYASGKPLVAKTAAAPTGKGK